MSHDHARSTLRRAPRPHKVSAVSPDEH